MVAPIGARANRLRNAHQAAHQPQCPVAQRLGSARLPSSGTAQLPARSHASGSAAPSRPSRHALAVSASAPAAPAPQKLQMPGKSVSQVNVVYKFGGSSVRDAERMREVADIICSFPHYLPCVVLSAMGKTTNMLLECGDLALQSTTENIPSMPPLQAIRKLHMDTCDQLQVEASCRQEVDRLLSELQQLLIGICIMQDLTLRAKDSLVSFGERLSTRIFASYLRVQGVNARQFDAPNLGVITTGESRPPRSSASSQTLLLL